MTRPADTLARMARYGAAFALAGAYSASAAAVASVREIGRLALSSVAAGDSANARAIARLAAHAAFTVAGFGDRRG